MKCFNRYPDQDFCFWLGFLTTGIFMGLYESGLSAVFEVLFSDETLFDSLPKIFIQDLFLYGIPAGIFAPLLGFSLRHFRPRSPHRWICLALLIPVVTFQLAVVQGIVQDSIANWLESGTMEFGYNLAEIPFGLLIYLAAALVSGAVAIAIIGSWKFLDRKFQWTKLMGNFSPEISW